MTRVLITGCRHWACLYVADVVLTRLQARYGDDLTIVHGACQAGVDAAFDDVAARRGMAIERHPADWDRLGKAAGPIRNRAMAMAGADFCIACHKNLGRSRGTRGMVELAIGFAIPCWWIADNQCQPVRVLGFSGFEVRVVERVAIEP